MDYLDELAGGAGARAEAREEPSLEIDGARRLAAWTSGAERILGWSPTQVLGKPILVTLIASRHRELFERMLDACFEGRVASPPETPVEVQAVHRDGREVTVEIRLSRVGGEGQAAVAAVFRDVTGRRELERLLEVNDAIAEAITTGRAPEHVIPHLLEQVCSIFGWAAGAYWRVDARSSRLQCQAFWRLNALAGTDLERLSHDARCARGEGVAGVAWARDRTAWIADLRARVGTRLEVAAIDADLNSAVAVPVRAGREILGVIEFFSAAAAEPGPARLGHLESIGLRLGRYLQDSPPAGRRRKRYKVDTRNSHLAFSCAFMKFLTVHGSFREFGGWTEVDDDDPRTARAECTIQTASVDTRSLERDFHLRSADFFAVERFPSMAFRSTTVEPLGDEHFRVFGELTVRDVTRPIQLDVRLEDRDIDQADVERMTISAGTVINRLDWFLDWERALQAGRWIVGNQVRLDLLITLVYRPDASLEPRR